MRPLALALAAALVLSSALAAPCAQVSQPPAARPSLDGAWTLNKELGDKPPAGQGGREAGEGERRGRGPGGGRGGGFSGPGFGGGRGEGRSPEDVQRLRNALRDELEAPEHLTIVESGSTIILTAGDGRTTRLSADGKKIKDESTGVERRTKWEAGKLVSEITGLGQGKILETYALDAEHRQLHVTLDLEGPQRKATVTRTYDADTR